MTTSAQAVAFLLFLLAANPGAHADSITVTPGKWEVVTSVQMPMLPGPRVEKTTECVKTGELSPGDFLDDSDECKLTRQTVNGNTLSWEVQCDVEGGQAKGAGSFTANDSIGNGTMRMEMPIQGHPFAVLTSWQAKRIGDCD